MSSTRLHCLHTGLFDELNPDQYVANEPHPESSTRVENIRQLLLHGPLSSQLSLHRGRHASTQELERFHTPGYVARLASLHPADFTPTTRFDDPETTWPAALAAAGTTLAALAAVMAGKHQVAYAMVRPPGHHASRENADGYCYLNNGAIAAEAALAAGVNRVCMLDVDGDSLRLVLPLHTPLLPCQ